MSIFQMTRRRIATSIAAMVCTSTFAPRMAFGDEIAPDAFQHLVIEIGTLRYPSLPLQPGRTALEVRWGDHHLYLGNIYVIVRQLSPDLREHAVLDFLSRFSPAADARTEALKAEARDWRKAQVLLRPKLFPIDTVRRSPHLVTRRLAEDVFIGYALDLGDKDLYVDNDKFAAWCRSVDDVHEAALSNLESMSRDLPLGPPRPAGATGGFAIIDTGDGYDAARILLPGLRVRLVESLGPKLMAGVPARDLFVAWSAGMPRQQGYEAKVREAAAKMPHAVTDRIFVIERGGIRLAAAAEL